jgi:hypothetical protein
MRFLRTEQDCCAAPVLVTETVLSTTFPVLTIFCGQMEWMRAEGYGIAETARQEQQSARTPFCYSGKVGGAKRNGSPNTSGKI